MSVRLEISAYEYTTLDPQVSRPSEVIRGDLRSLTLDVLGSLFSPVDVFVNWNGVTYFDSDLRIALDFAASQDLRFI